MIPVFYIGDGCGEIHLKMDKEHHFTIKVKKIRKDPRSRHEHFDGTIKSLEINGVDCSERYEGHRVTYPLLCQIYKDSTGHNLKYRSVVSARTNLEKVKEVIEIVAPDLRIDFKMPEKEPKANPISVDDQIFNFWIGHV